MRLLLRNIFAAAVIVTALVAWWYPEPALIRIELMQWDKIYGQLTAPPAQGMGAVTQAGALRRAMAARMTLEEFISSKTTGRTTTVADPAWNQIAAQLEQLRSEGRTPLLWYRPDAGPFAGLPGHFGYAELNTTPGVGHMEYRRIPARDYPMYAVPKAMVFPWRACKAWLAAAGIGALAVGFLAGRAHGLIATSSAGRGLRWSAVCAVFLTGLVLWPLIYDTGGSATGYASMVLGGLFLCGALLALHLFGRQARLLQQMITGDGCLAHFTFSPQEWLHYTEWDYGQEASQKKVLWLLVTVIAVLVGVGLMLVKRDLASVLVFVFLMGLMIVLRLLAVGLPRLTRRRNLRATGEVYVGKQGAYINGTVHSWQGWGARLESVKWRLKPLPHVLLIYSYRMFAGTRLYPMRQQVVVRIPIPAGWESRAEALIPVLQTPEK